MKSDDLLAIIDFLYCGEANVFQENLDSFLAIAEELQLKGLMGKTDEKVNDFEADKKCLPPAPLPAFNAKSNIPKTSFKRQNYNTGDDTTLAIPANFFGGLEELEERVKSMMEKSENKYANGRHLADRCKVCGKEGMGSAIKDHIEANHIEGIIIPCNLCDKTFRSRNSWRHHKLLHLKKSTNTY